MNFMGGAGMFAVSVYMMFMGGYYDRLISGKLPAGADMKQYADAAPGTGVCECFKLEAKQAAGPEIINATLIIPDILAVAFAGLFFYMKGRQKETLTKA